MNMMSSKKKSVAWGKNVSQEQAMREMKPKGRRKPNYQSKAKSSSTASGEVSKKSGSPKRENTNGEIKRNQVKSNN